MERETCEVFDLIDLGAVSSETRGGCTDIFEVVGWILPAGLIDD